jgi:hypothetical protein
MTRTGIACVFALAACAWGCMDPIVDYKECRAIEGARCDLRESCDPGFDVETCRAYYDEYCRTRELKGPGSETLTDEQLQDCLDAIAAFPCDQLNPAIDETEVLPECGFIQEVDAGDGDGGPDAG